MIEKQEVQEIFPTPLWIVDLQPAAAASLNGRLKAEIERMNALLISLSDDPRAALSPGFDDAGQVLLNLELVASLRKPPGFFDPASPAGLPPDPPEDDEDSADETAEEEAGADEDPLEEEEYEGVDISECGLEAYPEFSAAE